MEGGAKSAKAKVEARPTDTRRSRKVDSSTGLQLKQRLAEALEQHKAISEILQVIAASPSDVQPVLDAVAERALNLCDAAQAGIFLVEEDTLRFAARFGGMLTPEENDSFPLNRKLVVGRAVIDRETIHHADIVPLLDTEYPDARLPQQKFGFRALLGVPLMREDRAIGAIALWRMEARRFTDKQIALVKTFAGQATIAIENVRLFNETQEALERQTATSEILRVISQSPTDVQLVFDTIAAAALKLCRATSAVVGMVDGDLVRLATSANISEETAQTMHRRYPRKRGRDTAIVRAIETRTVVTIPDVLADPEYDVANAKEFRSALGVPLLRDGEPIGAIGIGRAEIGDYSEKEVALLQTFADQAVIAIENVRLFDEVQARTHDLTESLQQQTATADVLKVISRSAFDLQTVLDTLIESACKLCDATVGSVWRPDVDGFKAAAMCGEGPAHWEAVKRLVIKPGRDTCAGRALLEGRTVHIHDAMADPEYDVPDVLKMTGNRAMLGVPLLREGAPIGVLVLTRSVARPFTEKQIALATTFADQAVIAIENVRLFKETTEALERQTATSEILRVISRSPRDVQPVFDAIAERAATLCGAKFAFVTTFDGEWIHLRATYGPGTEEHRALYPVRPGRGSGAARIVEDRAPVQIPDFFADADYAHKDGARRMGIRSGFGAPMMRNEQVLGAIMVARPETGLIPEKLSGLLQTFADQAVIAIENVRLFTELESRTAQLSRSVEELRALGEVGQAVSSTLDLETVLSTIVSRATQLAGMDGGAIWEFDETREEFYLHATDRLPDELIAVLRATPIRKGEGALGRLATTGEPVEIRDIADERTYQSRVREILIRCGYRSVLALPLLREDHLLGALAVNRNSAGEFAPEVIELLKTFATQSALAIQNARLFREIEEKSRELATASRHKSEFLANMSHELRTPLNAIIGFSEVLAERMFGEINDKQAEYLADILESGRHLLSLINDILDLSKIEAGRMELEPTEFNLPDAIENTLTLVRERAHRHGIGLGRMVDQRLGTICADERKVKQVLLNLLSNALKFTPEGGRINVAATVTDNSIEISVSDTGVGIAAEDQAAVFEEFRQVGAASKKIEGTGLGLAISRKFIELHGGKIWVKSQVGAGSTFAFTLPLQ